MVFSVSLLQVKMNHFRLNHNDSENDLLTPSWSQVGLQRVPAPHVGTLEAAVDFIQGYQRKEG